MGKDLVDQLQPFHGMQFLKDPLAVRVAKINAVTYVVCQPSGIIAIQHSGHDLVRQIRHHLLILSENGIGLTHNGLHPACHPTRKIVLHQHHIGLQERSGLPQAIDTTLAHTAHHHTNGSFGCFDDLQHMSHRTHSVQVALIRAHYRQLTLGHQKNIFAFLHCIVQRQHGDLTFHIKPGGLAGKNRQPP